MYNINPNTIALEEGDKLTIVKDGGGSVYLRQDDESFGHEEIILTAEKELLNW
jgi:hypothetical protein